MTKCDIRFFSRRVRINSKTLKELLIRTNNDKSFVWDDKEIRTLITGNKIEAENFIAVRPYFTSNYKEYEYFDINSGKRLITTKKLFSNEETLKKLYLELGEITGFLHSHVWTNFCFPSKGDYEQLFYTFAECSIRKGRLPYFIILNSQAFEDPEKYVAETWKNNNLGFYIYYAGKSFESMETNPLRKIVLTARARLIYRQFSKSILFNKGKQKEENYLGFEEPRELKSWERRCILLPRVVELV
ncbi:MAG: hypothetical protein QXP82_03420 [Candidatus Aenigmatarchaeota archaeon]